LKPSSQVGRQGSQTLCKAGRNVERQETAMQAGRKDRGQARQGKRR
jgi:hypothetical protein